MQIFAKTWNSAVNSSKTIILEVEPEDLIEDVKHELRHKLGISPLVDIQLRFCSKILNNDQSLSSCNVTKEANIDVFLRKMSTSIPPSSVVKNDDSGSLPDYSEDSDDDLQNTDDNSILPDYSEDDGDVENPLISSTDDSEHSDDDIQNADDGEDNEWDTKTLFASEVNDAQTTQNSEDNEKDTKIPNDNERNAENSAVMLVTTNDEDTKKDEIKDVFQKFHDEFGKRMNSKTSKEIELRATKFKEKHDENIIISEKISSLKKSHDNNAKEITKEMEEIEEFRSTSLLTCGLTQRKKDKIDAKIKELQKESLELEKLLNSEHRKIKEKENAHDKWKKEKEI